LHRSLDGHGDAPPSFTTESLSAAAAAVRSITAAAARADGASCVDTPAAISGAAAQTRARREL